MAYYAESASNDPFENLARETLFCRDARYKGEPILYLWQNAPCVVIGLNQNPWLECDLKAMEEDGVLLVRRKTGGGAVYHDDGNLNYSFCVPEEMFDENRQYACLLSALAHLGIPAERTGRNDIVAGGMKISGNAFLHSNGAALQHGTLLIHSRLSVFGRYLTPDVQKFAAKGVRSVAARVGNLTAFAPQLTTKDVREAVYEAFACEYGSPSPAVLPAADVLAEVSAEFRSWDFRYGRTPRFDKTLSHRFPFGLLRLQLAVVNGTVTDTDVDSDMLDTVFPPRLAAALHGVRFESRVLSDAAARIDSPYAPAVAEWLLTISEQLQTSTCQNGAVRQRNEDIPC